MVLDLEGIIQNTFPNHACLTLMGKWFPEIAQKDARPIACEEAWEKQEKQRPAQPVPHKLDGSTSCALR